jgi:hypothetical protein
MQRSVRFLLLLLIAIAPALHAAPAKIVKVLPQYLDTQGRHTLSPSLYERDAYQVRLRDNPSQRSGIRFFIQWKAPKADAKRTFKMRVELRGAHGTDVRNETLEARAGKTGFFTNWASVSLTGEEYKKFGNLIAWRATLWDGDKQIDEQKSFLW